MADGAGKKGVKKAGAKKATSGKKAVPAKKAAGAKKGGAKKAAKKTATSSPRAGGRTPTHDEIARRAYEIHEREGGDHEQNWLRAERELKGS